MKHKQVQLRRLFSSSIGGSWGDPPEDGDVVLPCVRGTDLDFRRLRVKPDSAPLRSYTSQEVAYRAASQGDIIIEKSGGGDKQPVGRIALWDRFEPVMPTNFAGRLRPSPGHEPRYLAYLLAALYYEGRTVAAIKQTTGIQNLDLHAFLSTRVPLLELPTQRAIADYLDIETGRIDVLISKKRRMIELLRERVSSIIFDGVTGQLTSGAVCTVPSGVGWLGEIPDHFGTPWLGAFHTAQLGKMLNADAASGPEQYPYIKNTNVQWDCFNLEDLPSMTFDSEDRRRCELRPGDLLVCEGGEVGRSAVWDQYSQIYFQKALHRVRPLTNNVPRFLMYCLWAAATLNVFSVEGNQATIVHLTGEKLRSHRFPWPPLEEQKRIVSLIDSERRQIDRAVRGMEVQIELLAERRQALVTAAVTGELPIPGVAV